jgi:rubrerythrin
MGENMPKMTLGQAVRNAIEAEWEAARYYTKLAAHAAGDDAQHFLQDMAGQEVEHARDLERFAASLDKGRVPEAPSRDVGELVALPALVPGEPLVYEAALELALDAESRAHAAYASLADAMGGPSAAFFSKLALAELQHAEQLQRLLDAVRALG